MDKKRAAEIYSEVCVRLLNDGGYTGYGFAVMEGRDIDLAVNSYKERQNLNGNEPVLREILRSFSLAVSSTLEEASRSQRIFGANRDIRNQISTTLGTLCEEA